MTTLLVIIASSLTIYIALAIGLILSQPISPLPVQASLRFESIRGGDAHDPDVTTYLARDGARLAVRHYPGPKDGPLVVLIHGSGWHGGGYTAIGHSLSETYGFEVLIPDLRGHGVAPERRGDIDYIGQFEDDLADLIAAYGGADRRVYMVGHSSGGGLTIRFAGGQYGPMLDRAVLIAPFLKYDAPTALDNAGGWSHVLLRRVIGQSMLNRIGIHAADHLHMIQFNFPQAVLQGPQGHTATQSYSHRLNTSFAPRGDYLADIARLPPFLLIVGRQDDAFDSTAYEPTMEQVTDKGQYVLVDGMDHLGVISAAEALRAIGSFLGVRP